MKYKLKTFLILLILGALMPRKIYAQAYSDIGVSARAVGMGNAFTAVADDVYSIYYNPAGLATLERPEFATTYAQLYPGLTDNSSLQNSFFGYAQPLDEGRQGTVGLGFNRFSLNGLYQETSVYGSYGREISVGLIPGHLYGGVSFKYLDRSLGGAGNLATQPLGPTGQVMQGAVDQVLLHTVKSNFDMDLGLLYRPDDNWNFGFTSQHVLEPDIAFDPTQGEILARDYKFGAAYRTPFATLSSDFDMIEEPDTTMGEIISVGAEKWFPTLDHGTFGIRGGLSEGSLDFRQISMGLSYKIFRMQFDYGFALPLSGISIGSYGTQRFGITFRFGQTREERVDYGEALLENTGELGQVGTPEFKCQAGRLARFEQNTVSDILKQTHAEAMQGNFAAALHRINQAMSLSPRDMVIAESQARLAVVAQIYPKLKDYATNDIKASLCVGIIKYLNGDNKEAIEHLKYVTALKPADKKLKDMLKAMEALSGLVRAKPSALRHASRTAHATSRLSKAKAAAKAKKKVLEGKLAMMEVALGRKRYQQVIAMGRDVIKAYPTNALAYLRMGAAYYATKYYSSAFKAFEKSREYETNPKFLKKINAALDALRARKSAKPKKRSGQKIIPKASPSKIESLYESGVELYSKGKLKAAKRVFQKLLDIDPNYIPAQRALQRVRAKRRSDEGVLR